MIVGTIEDFDDRRGDGHLRGDDGELYYVHCVAIADGTRTIRVGARARARRGVGRLGYDEVLDVSPVTTP